VTPTKPLILETLFVTVERGLLERVDEIQGKFGGGFQQVGRNSKGDKRTSSIPNGPVPVTLLPRTEDRMTALVREGLSHLPVIHAGDVFPLPLPSHPITYERPPPAMVVECEPVLQGQISPKTKIVLIQAGSSQEKALKKLTPPQPIIEESLEDTAEETSNDQFYSAAEDRQTETASDVDTGSDEDSASDPLFREETDSDSDSMDDMISLSAPGLPAQPAGTLSAMTAATPRPGMKRAAGVQTPGSVYSSFTSATARAGSRPGKVFRTDALLRKIPTELLHPRPLPDDDEESFVFVDTSTLAKIGCFSGDWVRIEAARNVSPNGFLPAGMGGLNSLAHEEEADWRPVKIFGLSGLPDQKTRYAVDKTGDRRSSFSQREAFLPLTPALYLSPVLLTNLSNAPFVKVGALPKLPRHDPRSSQFLRPGTSRGPPAAKEVTLLKISTPVTTSRELQSTLFSGLKHHFENKKRVLKKGDFLAVPVDQELGRVISAPGPADGSLADDELITKLNNSLDLGQRRVAIAWFSVQIVDGEPNSDQEGSLDESWGGVATVDPASTRINSQAGTGSQPISDSIAKWTHYWLGMRKAPPPSAARLDSVLSAADLPPLEKLPLEKRLSDLVAASVSRRAMNLGLPPLVILLHSTQRQIGKTHLATSACSAAGVHTFTVSGHDLLSEHASSTGGGDVKTEGLLRARAERALSCGAQQTALLIQHIDVLTADRMVPTLQDIISSSRVLLATSTKIDDIPPAIRSLFSHELEVTAPNETARELILRNACVSASIPLAPTINLKSFALQTAALVAGDLLDVVNRASLARASRLLSLAESQHCRLSDVFLAGGQATTHLLPSDFTTAISAARSTFSDAIGAPKIPTVTWDDVGGLASQKDAIMETISLPLTRPELFAHGIRKRSGILFYGPPGTGKTLLAKAIATEFSLNFFSVKGPELLNMYIGESEANVRRVFQRARDARPCVVFFDELDSVAPKRGNQGDSGGVMDRIVSQLLAELDGMSSSGGSNEDEEGSTSPSGSAGGGVFVIGATNRPDLLDPALLRPGRFDKMLYLGVADTHQQQVTILEALTRKFTLAPDVNLPRVAERLPFTYTGADLYALCSDAMLKAITRKTRSVDERVKHISTLRGEEISTGYFFDHLASVEDVQVVVNEQDFQAAQEELVGSVSQKELAHFERIRRLFEEQDITVGPKNESTAAATPSLPLRPAVAPTPDDIAASFPPRTQPQPQTQNHIRSRGKQKEKTGVRNRMPAAIANPDSGAESEYHDDADADDDYSVSSPHLNGSAISNGTRVKGKGKAVSNSQLDGFMDGVEGDDEGLYD